MTTRFLSLAFLCLTLPSFAAAPATWPNITVHTGTISRSVVTNALGSGSSNLFWNGSWDLVTVPGGGGNLTASGTPASTNTVATASDLSGTNANWRTIPSILGFTPQASGNYITAITGDVTASGPGSAAATLANSGVTAGTYGDSTHFVVPTYDAKGRVTGATTNLISTGQTNVASANPTATISGTAVNGTAKTFLTSDSAPALSTVGTPGTYSSVTTDANGRVTNGSNPAVTTAANWNASGATNSTLAGNASMNALAVTNPLSSLGVWNVRAYGAVGDGSTSDDAAIVSALSAIPLQGGILFFPPGTYSLTNTITLAKRVTILGSGVGMARWTNTAPMLSSCTLQFINTNSYGISITTNAAEVRNIQLYFTNAVSPTSGALITVQTNGVDNLGQLRFALVNVGVDGGYDGIDINAGSEWIIHGCNVQRWSGMDGIRVNNKVAPDTGDWSISDTVLQNQTYHVRSCLRWESSGGCRISNSKFNSFGGVGGYDDGSWLTNAIDIACTNSAIATGIFLVNNCSIEGFSSNGITSSGTAGTFIEVAISNCQFGEWSTNTSKASQIAINLANGVGDDLVIGNIVVGGNTTATPIKLRGFSNATIGPVQWGKTGASPVDSDGAISGQMLGDQMRLYTPSSNGGISLIATNAASATHEIGLLLSPNLTSSTGLSYINWGNAESTGNCAQMLWENHGNNNAANAFYFSFWGYGNPAFRMVRNGTTPLLSTSGSMNSTNGFLVGSATGITQTNSWTSDSGATNWTQIITGGIVTSMSHSP